MKSSFALGTLAIAATLIGSGSALAQEGNLQEQVTIISGDTFGFENLVPPRRPVAGKTRAQVQAELVEAIRTGDMYVGDTSRKAYEVYPSRYPARPVVAGTTREQVQAELAEAIRTDSILSGDSSMIRDLAPRLYPATPAMASTHRSPDAGSLY